MDRIENDLGEVLIYKHTQNSSNTLRPMGGEDLCSTKYSEIIIYH